tara:strand:+ start:146 stop:733 length:588 start_codon:yes stop_codon:yes gene_type:complete
MFYNNSEVEFPNWWEALNDRSDQSQPSAANGPLYAAKSAAKSGAHLSGFSTAGSAGEASQEVGKVVVGEGVDDVDFGNFSDDDVSEDGYSYPLSEAASDLIPSAMESAASFQGRGYDRDVVRNVWEFAEVVPGIDSDLWRKDEFGDWIYRLDYGRRSSEFGWEIFDPGVGRHSQGVYAMRPMQWQSFIRQYEVMG